MKKPKLREVFSEKGFRDVVHNLGKLVKGTREIPIGKEEGNVIVLGGKYFPKGSPALARVSRRHGTIILEESGILYRDHSNFGTDVIRGEEGRTLHHNKQPYELQDGDELYLGAGDVFWRYGPLIVELRK